MDQWLLGFDIGGTKCAAILGKTDGEKICAVEKSIFATSDFPTPGTCIAKFIREAEILLKKYPDANAKAIGISCGGPLDSKAGIIQSPPNLPGWDDVPICRLLTDHFHLPVNLCNDADACALAEWKYGAGRGTENMIFLTFGTGMGAGLILNGKLYTGACGMAGECGHIRLAEDGPEGYGKRGSFEGFCSGGGIAQLAKSYAKKHLPLSWCETEQELKEITAKKIALAAANGDPAAKNIMAESGRRLGQALAVMIDLLNPEMIVIGSIFQRSESLLRPEMGKILELETLAKNRVSCRIVPAELADTIGDIASLSVALR